jgi:acyl-CoA reductase-like NAD-dependent aldehyde dehydrogenase
VIHFPIMRWGKAYKSLETQPVVHFATGETLAEVSQANGALVQRDMRKAAKAREVLRKIPCAELLDRCKKAADLFTEADLPAGEGGTQSPEDFVKYQSATTGLPEHMCRFNMGKLHYVLTNLDEIITALTRGLPLDILTDGYGEEGGVMRSYQANAPVLGMVLPSNSPGVHGLWLPVIPMQIGLVLKPGPQEPWTPYRMAEAFFAAGIPRETICIYPGGPDVGAAVVQHTPRVMMFGGEKTIEQYKGNPSVQVHGPGFSKILLGEDEVDNWEEHLDLMAKSVFVNSGRSCISCSGIWAPRHTQEIAEAIAERIGPIQPEPPEAEESPLAAFTIPEQADGINAMIDKGLEEEGNEDITAKHREGDRLIREETYAYLRPTIVHCDSPDRGMANIEYMFPFASVVECPQDQMIKKIGPTLVASAITKDEGFRAELLDATNIDRLNFGQIPTIQLNWLQPHEGNIVDFLFRARAFQTA